MLKLIPRYFSLCMMAIACLLSLQVDGQTWDYVSMKEKVYLDTDHVYYKPGETVFFKCYLVDARTQRPSFLSKTIYVEIVAPAGNVAQRLTLPATDGYAEASWTFDASSKGGIYKIRAYTTWMRNEDDRAILTKEIYLQKLIAPRILMKLDFKAKGYGAGDEALADFSMRNLQDKPIAHYDGNYTVSIGGQVISTAAFKTDEQGKAQIRFRLPTDLKVNDGLLNVTVQYNAFTESVSRSIPITLNKIDLQFLPEGGLMVAGLPATVAFKAVDEFGKGVDVRGNIIDEAGHIVTAFAAFHRGMGKCSFTPQPGITYKARVSAPAGISDQFNLPAAAAKGVAMKVEKAGGKILVSLMAGSTTKVTLLGYSRDSLYYSQELVVKDQQVVEIDESLFPIGIIRFLVSAGGQPQAERLVFLNGTKHLRISLTPDKQSYKPREKVVLNIKTTDEQDHPIASNLSLAVVDDKLWTLANDKQHNILSWLLVGSELAGTIEEPSFYFDPNEAAASEALDLVMLTHGYRYFDLIPEVVKGNKLKYFFDQGQVISGMVVDRKGKPLQTKIYLVEGGYNQSLFQYTTGQDGAFLFSNLKPGDDYLLMAKPVDREQFPVIKLFQNAISHTAFSQLHTVIRPADRALLPDTPESETPATNAESQPFARVGLDEALTSLGRTAHLEDVVVVGYSSITSRMVTSSVTQVQASDINGNPYLALQGRVPGLVVIPQANQLDASQITLRGMRSLTGTQMPLIVLDGMPVDNVALQSINAADITSVTVLKDAVATTLYGSQAANGVIAIESKKMGQELFSFNVAARYGYGMLRVPPIQQTRHWFRRFYAPIYANVQTTVRDDFRETIYWNGVVQTNRKGEATVEFCNSDASTTFRAIAEGIGYNGVAGRQEMTYAVTEPMSVDIKIPPYFTVGDKALLPLVVRNNSQDSLVVLIDLYMPKGLALQDFDCVLRIGPDTARQLLIPVLAKKALYGTISMAVEGNGHKQLLSWPITVNEQGFPASLVLSGARSEYQEFSIEKPVAGSIRSSLTVYRELEEQVFKGIESMIREPYGCFEQTSSTLYPNILILKYLKSKGKPSQRTESRAMRYIRSGYNRLLSFETSKGGYEWFGSDPGNTGLTAYALLEFTDMADFVEVDKKMLLRTKNFLLDLRDNMGGFKLARQYYEPEQPKRYDVTNCYIVYAISRAGMGQEIVPEYRAAVKRALQVQDGYMVVMMANAALTMKQEGDYRLLMDLANRLYRENGLKAYTSMVGAYGRSLNVEVLSLYALALMQDKNGEVATLHKVLTSILKSKTYYGYGSTQSTVLALQAIIAYNDFVKAVAHTTRDTKIVFTINDMLVLPDSATATLLHAGKNILRAKYDNDSSFIPYEFEVQYHTLLPPSSEKAALALQTKLGANTAQVGETVRMDIVVTNKVANALPMTVAKIGIPAGLSVQPWQLKEIMEKNQAAYYEIFDNWLVFYWTYFDASETKKIALDLKAEIGGSYKAKASNVYQYYTPEDKHWNEGLEVTVEP